jgi:hypothetical protein
MKKNLLVFTILILIFGIYFFLQFKASQKISSPEKVGDLSEIILENTEFKTFNHKRFLFKHPDWQKIEIDTLLLWPREISEKQELLLYLSNSDGVKILVTKREVETEYIEKPYPLIFREMFTEEQQILEERGEVTEWDLITEKFFENGVLIESKVVVFGTTNASIQKSIIVTEDNSRFIYSVGVSAQEEVFGYYRPLVKSILDSIRYY